MLALQLARYEHRVRERRFLVYVAVLLAGVFVLSELGLDLRDGTPTSLSNMEWVAPYLRYCLALVAVHLAVGLLQPRANQLLLPIAGLLGGLSLALLYRLPTPYWDATTGQLQFATRNLWYVERQSLFLLLGLGVVLLIMTIPGLLRRLRDYRWLAILLGLGLLLVTALYGRETVSGGPRVALDLGFVQFQPAELIKLLFVIYLAGFLRYAEPELRRLTYRPLHFIPFPRIGQLRPILILLGTALVFLVWMSDLGAALLLIFILPAMMYVALPRRVFWYLAALLFVVLFLIGGTLSWVQRYGGDLQQPAEVEEQPWLERLPARISAGLDRVTIRLDNYRDPWAACPPDSGCPSYQNLHALYAIAAGGILGSGPGQGQPDNIPFVHTDMVYAALVEEWGLLGAVALLLLYWLLVMQALRIARRQTDLFYTLLAAGIGAIFAVQCFVIIGGAINIIPFTGITLPFLSYGGTATLVNFMMIGLLLRLSGDAQQSLDNRELSWRLEQLGQVYSVAFLLLLLGTAYWALFMHSRLNPAFPEADAMAANPVAWQRRAAQLSRVQRGRIYAADGSILADNTTAGRYLYMPEALHVVGQADSIGQGLSGVEYAYNDLLLGRRRFDLETLIAQNFSGSWRGNDLTLTLEPAWQRAADEGLGGYRGAVVVLDAETGAVLAMVSHPLYDPAVISDTVTLDAAVNRWDTPFLNRAVSGLYPPGSTFKTVVAAAALEEELVEPDSRFDFSDDIWFWSDDGRFCHKQWVAGAVVESCNSDQYEMSFAEGYALSDNVLFAQLAVELGAEGLWQAAAGFGFGEEMSFELPLATSRMADEMARLSDGPQLAQSGFGQGRVLATPLQMALVAATIANDGELPQPYLVAQVTAPDGGVLDSHRPHILGRAVSRGAAREMAEIMVASVENGWAGPAAVPGLEVGGKTGTAEWQGSTAGQPPHAWYIGFARLSSGRTIAIAVLAEAAGEGSEVAAPIAAYVVGRAGN